MALPAPSLTARALRLLSAREHSRSELERKLARFEEEPGSLAQALDRLVEKGFISEARVVESVLHRRSAKLGSLRIKQELQAKGLEPQAVAQAMHDLRSSELERAREVWRKKFNAAAQSPQERGKQMRFLLSRGFAAEVVQRIVGGSAHGDADLEGEA